MDEEVRDLLEQLSDFAGGAVALISGRSIADIDALFPEAGLAIAGQHGLERRDASGAMTRHEIASAQLELARHRIVEAVARYPGLLVEYKGLSLALHYRAAPRLAGFAHRLVHSLQAEIGPDYCIQKGKRVVELKPAGKDKGIAVTEFMGEKPFRGRTPVFVGDDATDEYAFAVVNDLGGLSIKVGSGQASARWRLRDISAVKAWLQQLRASTGGGNGLEREPKWRR